MVLSKFSRKPRFQCLIKKKRKRMWMGWFPSRSQFTSWSKNTTFLSDKKKNNVYVLFFSYFLIYLFLFFLARHFNLSCIDFKIQLCFTLKNPNLHIRIVHFTSNTIITMRHDRPPLCSQTTSVTPMLWKCWKHFPRICIHVLGTCVSLLPQIQSLVHLSVEFFHKATTFSIQLILSLNECAKSQQNYINVQCILNQM